MDFFFIPRRVARLQYMTARLPFTVLDEYVVARYWAEGALPRLGWELFLGSMDGFAGWLLADDHISRRGHAVMRRPESPATASEPETMVQARWAQYEENLQAAQAAAHEDDQQARRKAEAQAEAEKAPAEHAAETRAAEAEQAPQAAQIPISAGQDRVSAAASQQRPDAADNRRLVRYRPEEPTAPASSP
jgi:hypothetical protein